MKKRPLQKPKNRTMQPPKKWIPPKIWENGTAFIIGGGPSVKKENLNLIHNRHVIGVNNSYMIGDWIDIGWFGDKKWLVWHKKEWINWHGIKATCNPNREVIKNESDWLKFMARGKSAGIETKPGFVSWNYCSGSSAINLAYHLGVTRIVLIGYDMHNVDNKRNWHTDHKDSGNAPYARFLKCYPEIARDAENLGVEIINTCKDSAIKCLPYQPLKKIV
jgi:hypothetical protein